jgi:sulfide:quinone oxidoreductase
MENSLKSQTIVVIGGGVGGVVAANELRRRLPRAHRVILAEKNSLHAFAPSFLWIMTGERQPDQVRRPLAKLLREGVEVLHTEVKEIDAGTRTVQTAAGEIVFDQLVIALGAELAPGGIPGLQEASHTFYTLDGARRLQETLMKTSSGRIAVAVASVPYKCPGAPHEGAMLIADHFRRRGLSGRVKIDLFTPEPQPMPVAGPKLGEAVRTMLESNGIGFHPMHKLQSVEPESKRLRFENGTDFEYDLLVAIPPHRAPAAVAGSDLVNAAGWIPVDARTLSTRHPGIYAIGDVTTIPLPGRWKADAPLMLPKAGVFAHAQAEVVAARIANSIAGHSADVAFSGDGYCILEAGRGEAGFAFGNFFAEPAPKVTLRQMGRPWHVGKVLFEKWWLAPPGSARTAVGWAMKAGGRFYGIPVAL